MAAVKGLMALVEGLMRHGMPREQALVEAEKAAAGKGLLGVDLAGGVPRETAPAYKMFRMGDDQQMYPLFVDANTPVSQGEWLNAIAGELGKGGKVKSKIGELAYRPGWHAGDSPVATHIGGKSTQGLTAPDYRKPNQVWAGIEMGADFPWQEEALRRADYSKAGNIIPRTAHITDQIPYGGYYRYKTNPNMTGEWLIGGQMKVGDILSPADVKAINDAKGLADLPQLDEVIRANGLNKADLTNEAMADLKKYYPDLLANMKMLTGTAVGAGALGAGLMPQEAEAAPWKTAADALERMLAIGMVKPEAAANPSAVKSAYTKYLKAWKDSEAFREREQMAYEADEFVKFSETPLGSRIVADLEKIVGQPIMPVRGDRSNIGLLESVGGRELNVPVEGGNKFSQQQAGTGAGWASMFTVAKSVQNKINKIAEQTGQSPIAIYNAMGEQATNFSTPIAEAMLKEANQLPLDKADISKFDAEMRKAYPDWVGLRSPSAMDQLMGTGDFPMEGAGKMRTAFTTLMGKAAYRDRGFPSYDKLIAATRDPALAGAQLGESGLSMFKTIPQESQRGTSTHKSYDTAIGGDYIGGLPDLRGVPFEIMFPEIMKIQGSRLNAGGKPFTYEQQIDAANKRSDAYQIADQQWLDTVASYLENTPSRTILGGAGLLGSGLASAAQDPIEQLRQSEAEFGMSDQDRAIAALRRSERDFRAPTPTSEAYARANEYWDKQRQAAADAGATFAEFMMPDYEYSQKKAEGDTSFTTGLWAALEKLDPVGYVGLLDAIRGKR